MNPLVDATVAFLASDGPPMGVFLLALLTHPSRWTNMAVDAVRRVAPGSA